MAVFWLRYTTSICFELAFTAYLCIWYYNRSFIQLELYQLLEARALGDSSTKINIGLLAAFPGLNICTFIEGWLTILLPILSHSSSFTLCKWYKQETTHTQVQTTYRVWYITILGGRSRVLKGWGCTIWIT